MKKNPEIIFNAYMGITSSFLGIFSLFAYCISSNSILLLCSIICFILAIDYKNCIKIIKLEEKLKKFRGKK